MRFNQKILADDVNSRGTRINKRHHFRSSFVSIDPFFYAENGDNVVVDRSRWIFIFY